LLDEFAFHEKPGEIWNAVYPIITNPLKGELKLRIERAAHVSIDSTGIGGPVAESLAKQLGEHKLTCINFNNNTKRELFARMKKNLQSGTVRIPADKRLRDDITSLNRIVTPQGVVKYAAARTRDGHADRATALALALDAASKQPATLGLSKLPMILGHISKSYRPRRTNWRVG